MQARAIHPHRPTILSCLYYDSSNCVNSILWFLYLRSSRTTSTVCLWFILPFFFFSGASPAPPCSRGKSRSVFYQGTFTLNLQDVTLAGCRWSLTGLQTETSQQNGRPEWPNCTLNFTTLSPFLPFLIVFCYIPLCFLLMLHVLVFHMYLKKKDALRRKNNEPLKFYFFSTTLETERFLCQYPKISCLVWLIIFMNVLSLELPVCSRRICPLLKPYSPTGVQVSAMADWPLFLVVSRLAFFFLLLRTMMYLVCVCVRACVILFPDLELIPFKTLLKTFMWDWFMFASTIAPHSSLNPKGNPGRQKQSPSLWWDFECYLLPDLCCILYMIHTFGLICKFALIAD